MDQIENVCACKIVVVGDSGVGKTSMIIGYSQKVFQTENVPKVASTYIASTKILNTMVNLTICDTASQQEYDRLRPLAYPKANVFIVVFSLNDPSSFQSALIKWLPQIKDSQTQPKVIFAGNKKDLIYTQEGMTREQADWQYDTRRKIEKLGHKYIECSTAKLEGLQDLIEQAISMTLEVKKVPLLKRKDSASGGSCQLI